MLFPNAGVEINPALLLGLGLILGTLSGFFGVGGGFLITGGLLVFGVPPLFAVGTGLTVIMGTSMINTLKHRRVGNVDFRLGFLMVLGTVPAVFLASRLNSQLEAWDVAGPVLRYTYVIFLGALGIFILYDHIKTRTLRSSAEETTSTRSLAQRISSLRIPPHSIGIPGYMSVPTTISLRTSGIERISIWVPIIIGVGVGFFAGLLGAGGGFILMPVLIFVLGVPTTVAVGTDLFQVVITGSVGTLFYALDARVDLLMALIMLATASAGAQLGVAATRYVDGSRIRFLYGITVLSGSISVALEQVSDSGVGPEFLSDLATIVLLGVSGTMCVIITKMLISAKRKGSIRPQTRTGRTPS